MPKEIKKSYRSILIEILTDRWLTSKEVFKFFADDYGFDNSVKYGQGWKVMIKIYFLFQVMIINLLKIFPIKKCVTNELAKKTFVKQGRSYSYQGQDTYSCDLCDKKYLDIGSLNRHINSIHKLTYEYPCIMCGSLFNSLEKLLKHLNSDIPGH